MTNTGCCNCQEREDCSEKIELEIGHGGNGNSNEEEEEGELNLLAAKQESKSNLCLIKS